MHAYICRKKVKLGNRWIPLIIVYVVQQLEYEEDTASPL